MDSERKGKAYGGDRSIVGKTLRQLTEPAERAWARAAPDVSAAILGFLTGLLLVTPPLGSDPLEGQEPSERTAIAELSPAVVERGRALYRGHAGCHTCHGPRGRGVPGMAGSLADSEWSRVDGSPGSLLEIVRSGVPAARSPTGVPMPPRGGARLDEAAMRAVVAYVLSLQHEGG